MMFANAYNALIFILAFWSSPQRMEAIGWSLGIFVFVAYHSYRNFRSPKIKPSYISTRATIRAICNAFGLGCMWAALPVIFFSNASVGEQIFIACLCAGMLGGGIFAFASIPAAAIAFAMPLVIGSALAITHKGGADYLLVGLLMVSYIAVLMRGAFLYTAQISKRITEQIDAETKARRDELTDLPNRLAFFEGMKAAFARLARVGEHFAVLYIDLNEFKDVNDKFGHAVGDKLLSKVGRRLKVCAREIDTVSRLGGDEFAIILANTPSFEAALAMANRVVRRLDAPFELDGQSVCVSACIGIALAPMDGTESETLLKHADEALYAAKRGIDGVIQVYDSGHKEHVRWRRTLERDMRYAFRRHELFLVFQPIKALATGNITAAEALLRWNCPKSGIRLPADFMGVIEETDLIDEIGNWIICEACRVAASWPNDTRVAVNVSPNQLRNAKILSVVVRALADSGLAPHRLEFEITETALIGDEESIVSNLQALRELGVRIALDDFGTGYSSLTYLRKLAPDSIKIDGSFVRDVIVDSGCASIVKSMISLSKDLGINVVAEGIEKVDQLSFVRSHGCNEGQGYFIAKPKSENGIIEFLSGNGEKAEIGAA